ncbi:unnamed protein product, partial [Mesorhabditis spiculigera]
MEAHPDLLDKFVKYAAGKERCGVAVGWANVNHHMPKTVLCDVAGPPYTQEKGCWTLPSTRSYESLSVAFYEMFTEPDGKQIRVFYSTDLFLVLLVGHACLGGLLVLVAAAAARLYQMNRPAAPHRQSVARRDSSTSNVSASRSRSSASNSEERKRPVARSLKRPRQH